jgi:hypothetical protein
VCKAVGKQRVHARPGGHYLQTADAARCGITVAGGGYVAAHLGGHPAGDA